MKIFGCRRKGQDWAIPLVANYRIAMRSQLKRAGGIGTAVCAALPFFFKTRKCSPAHTKNSAGLNAQITKNIKHGFAQFVGSGPFDQLKEEGEEELKKGHSPSGHLERQIKETFTV